MQTEVQPTEVSSPELTVKAKMSFYLIENLVESNEIILKESAVATLRENLIKEAEKKDEKGLLVIHGSTNSPHDFAVIPWKNIIGIKFAVEEVK